MESGIYVTFFRKDEPADRELPPVGPLDRVVLRHRQLIAERGTLQQAEGLGVSIDRWLEAELELQRATGEEPGGTKRPEMRLTSPDGVLLRFTVFGETHEREPLPELGPFASIVIGPRGVEGDSHILALRSTSDLAAWELSSGAGDDSAGLHKPDIAFRTPTGAYHTSIPALAPHRVMPTEPSFAPPPQPRFAPAPQREPPFAPPPVEPPFVLPPRDEPAFTPPPRSEAAFTPPAAEPLFIPPATTGPPPTPTTGPLFKPTVEPLFRAREAAQAAPPLAPRTRPAQDVPALTARDLELIERIDRERAEETLRARIQEEERRRLGVGGADDTSEESTTWAMRYRPQASTGDGLAVGGSQSGGSLLWRLRFVLIGILLISAGLYGFTTIKTGFAPGAQSQVNVVGIATRVTGPRWDYLVNSVQRIKVSGTAVPRGEFLVVRVILQNRAQEGLQASPSDFSVVDAATGQEYGPEPLQGDAYTTNPQVAWPEVFPVGKNVITPIVFDVDPGKQLLLVIREVPKTRIKLS